MNRFYEIFCSNFTPKYFTFQYLLFLKIKYETIIFYFIFWILFSRLISILNESSFSLYYDYCFIMFIILCNILNIPNSVFARTFLQFWCNINYKRNVILSLHDLFWFNMLDPHSKKKKFRCVSIKNLLKIKMY